VITDNELNILQALQNDDTAAFDGLFRTWYAPLVRYAHPLCQNDTDSAEDLVQQVFLKFWEQRAKLNIQFSIKAYLYRMVYHQALGQIRSEKTQQRYIEHQTYVMEPMSSPAPDEAGTELQQMYQTALQKLPTQCKQVFELSRFESLKYREIADQLGLSVKTVEAHMGKALRVLRTELQDYLVTISGFVGSLIALLWN
jgi:RNA polymerase sigma-70 factor (ECF subfamily)